MAKESLLEMDNLSLAFPTANGPLSAIEDISLIVNKGDFISIVGPSGCGKSTLLNIIGGFLKPTKGTIVHNGEPLNGPSWERGAVFQKPALFPWLSVAQNVAFGLKVRKIPARKRKEIVRDHLKRVKLWEFRGMSPYELSGGMQQRVAIARVLANDPYILLMDEPFGALDALTREHLQDELLSIWRETHKTVLFITHSVEEAIYLSTKVLVMSERPGRILAEIESPFSRDYSQSEGREMKSLPEFVKLREEVLKYIWK